MKHQLSNKLLEDIELPELFLTLGGLPGQTPPESFNRIADPLVYRRIGQSEKALIANNNEWQSGKIYNAWGPDITSNYYVYNTQNRIVYICTDNKPNNRIDEEAQISTDIPSHAEPEIRTYDDGYSWIPYFKVDISQLNFLSQRDLPIPTLTKSTKFSSFSDKYNSLCGQGTTAFGCCCLYFKDNSVDEITSEVYSAGDLTNETIFSDCFECQKLADSLDREVTFLSGYTAGSITSSETGENPLCPATKTLNTLQEELTAEQYTIVPGSSREYALHLLNNFQNEKGILSARINLSGLTDAQKTVTSENPVVTLKDVTGTGASIRLLTEALGYNQFLVNGIELLSSGENYSEVTDWSLDGTSIDDYIELVHFPENFYNDPTVLISGDRYRIICEVSSTQLAGVVNTGEITKIAILANPKFYASDAPAIYPSADVSFINAQTIVHGTTGVAINIA